MEAVETYERNGCTVRIFHDEDSCNPLTNFTPLGTIHAVIPRGNRFDGTEPVDRELIDRLGEDGYARYLRIFHDAAIVVPVYLTGYPAFAVVTRAELADEYGTDEDACRDYLTAQAHEYRQWLDGETYGYVVTDPSGEHVDSCWGYYGSEYVQEEANRAADEYVNEDDYPEPADHFSTVNAS